MTPINRRKKLLLVDDSAINIAILAKILQGDYELLSAENGRIALDILRATDSIDAVILDIIMPVMDGFEVLRHMRADSRMSQIPVVVASGQDDVHGDDKEIKALSLGANDYVTKPYKPDIIKHRIANAIYLHETAAFVNTVQHDALTWLYSKEYFYLQVEEIKKKNPTGKYDMVCCDIENFKLVNERYGTSVGDALLRYCADICRDDVGKHGICGRIGPDIFAFFIEHREQYTNELFARAVARINEMDIDLNVQLKYGIYIVDDMTIPVNLICDRAQLAIAEIKGKYEVYFHYYDDAVRKKMLHEQYIVSHMKQALANGEFEVYFQPKYELKSETVVGAEALIRWNDPEKGFLLPGQFVPLFERNGFITDLDRYVWETCCKKIRAWLDQGNIAIPISVNVSRTDLYNPHIEDVFLSLLRKYSLSPRYMHLEITESAYTENPQQLIETVLRLKKIGFKIEMDDFGIGYSSLNMLSELPIDVVKLDIGFLQDQERYNRRSVLSFIISLAKWMNLGIISEGVETAEQASLLRSLGCECAQGFFYARPMPALMLEKLLLQQFEKLVPAVSHQPEVTGHANIYHPSTIVMIDENGGDFAFIESMFADKYEVRCIPSSEYLHTSIQKDNSQIELVIYAPKENINQTLLVSIIDRFRPQQIPIIAIVTSQKDVDIAINIGATDYILKPFNEIGARNRIQNVISSTKVSRFEIESKINAAINDMKKRAEQDSLTELLNRAEFENRVDAFFCDNDEPSGCFIMLDLDNFKNINDAYGHAAGDEALQTMARSLHMLFPEIEIIGRLGGDEFALFIPHTMPKEDLIKKAQMLCRSFDIKPNHMTATCSIGLCVSPENGRGFRSLYECADIALLQAKRDGKNRYCFYQPGMEMSIDERPEKESAALLDNTADAVFVCDAVTSQLIYINDTACSLIGKGKNSCLGARCYQLFWDKCQNCDRCHAISGNTDCFYEEDMLMKDGIRRVHLKAKVENWSGRQVKIHYLTLL